MEKKKVINNEFNIINHIGKWGRKHKLYIKDETLFFDTADEEYDIGEIKLSELKEKIEEYEKEKSKEL